MVRVEFSSGLANKQYSNSVPKWPSVDSDSVEEGRLYFFEQPLDMGIGGSVCVHGEYYGTRGPGIVSFWCHNGGGLL